MRNNPAFLKQLLCIGRILPVIILLLTFNCLHATDVNGDQGDSVWTLTKSPYKITGNVTIPINKILTIEPGVEVQFPTTVSQITAQGTLKAEGTSAQPIKFISLGISFQSRTGPIIIEATSQNSSLRYVNINGLGYYYRDDYTGVIVVRSSSCTIQNCNFQNINASGVQFDNASPLVSNNVFSTTNMDVIAKVDDLKNLVGNGALKVGLLPGLVNDSVLSASNLYYRLLGNFTIPPNRTFVINPGVEVQFPTGVSQITAQGTLKAEGTSAQPIKFTNLGIGFQSRTGPIIIEATSQNSSLRYVNINGLGYYYRDDYTGVIVVRSSSCTIQNCNFQNINASGVQFDNASPLVSNNVFSTTNMDVIAKVDDLKNLVGNGALKVGLLPGLVNDSVLSASNLYYRLLGNFTIPPNRTFVINPGVEVQFPTGVSQITAQGTLKAEGTSAQPIKFTNLGIGFQSRTGPIIIEATSQNSSLRYVNINGLGYYYNDDYTGVIVVRSSSCTVQNCNFQNISGSGVQFDNASPLVSNNVFSTARMDVVVKVDDLKNLVGNGALKVGLLPGLVSDSVLSASNLYYRLLGNFTIPPNRTLVISPGVEVQFPTGVSQITAQGTLKAEGTSAQPIKFTNLGIGFQSRTGPIVIEATSQNSSLRYVNINGLGYYYNDDYTGVIVVRSSSCTVQNCNFQNISGSGVQFDNASPLVSNNVFSTARMDVVVKVDDLKNLVGNGALKVGLLPGLVSDSVLSASNLYYRLLGNFTIPPNRTLVISPGVEVQFPTGVSQITAQGTLKAEGTSAQPIKFTNLGIGFQSRTGPIVIEATSQNSSLRYVNINGLGYYYNDYNTGAVVVLSSSCTIQNCNIQSISGVAILIQNTISPKIQNNTFSNNSRGDIGSNALCLSNILNNANASVYVSATTIAQNVIWSNPGTTSRYVLNGTITVNPTFKLTIAPGTKVDFNNNNGNIVVKGAITAIGTDTSKIQFVKQAAGTPFGGTISFDSTSTGSSLVHVNINRLGSVSSPAKSAAVELNTAAITISNVTISNSENNGLVLKKGSPVITKSSFLNNKTGVLSTATRPAFTQCSFSGNTLFAINNATPPTSTDTVDAPGNWWGDVSGPRHPTNPTGIGDSISSKVKYGRSVLPQNILFAALPDKIFGDSAFLISASASSGMPVSFNIKSGPAAIAASNFVTITGAGIVVIEAKQNGDTTYDTAPVVTQSFTVHKALQTITFDAVLDTSSGSTRYILAATSSAGLPVSFTDSGYADITGNVLSFTGSGRVKVTAASAGNQNYEPASAVKIFCISAVQPGSISGFQQACTGSKTYQVAALPGVLFRWTLSGGGNMTVSNNNTTATVNWNTIGSNILTVTAYTACDTVNKKYSTLTIQVINNVQPGSASNLYPAAETVITAFPFSLSWAPGTNAQLYDLYIWKDGLAQPSTPVIADIPQIATAIYPQHIPALNPGTKYRWRVYSKNGCGTTLGTTNSTFIISDLPNLKAKKTDVAAEAFAGTFIDVSAEIQNTGNASTRDAHWIDAVYLSADTFLTAIDTYLGGKGNIRELAPGEFYQNIIRVQIPYSVLPGKWYILTEANKHNNVGEITRNDNKGFDSILIKTPQVPDLKMVLPVTLNPSDPFSGQQMQVSYIVKNAGTADAVNLNWKDYIFLSPDSGLNSNNILGAATQIGEVLHNGNLLKRDSSYAITTTIQLPVRVFGKMFMYVVANAESSFYENFRNDNLAQTGAFTITLTPPPDFAVAEIHAPAKAAGGETIPVGFYVINQGASKPNRTEKSWVDGIYISRDSVFDLSTATLLWNTSPAPFPAMDIEESYHTITNITIPTDITDSVYLYVYTDKNNDIFEYNKEDNNTARRKIKIINPDLVIDSIAVTDSALAGTEISVEYRLKNAGPGKLLPTPRTDKCWLSANPVYSSTGLILLKSVSSVNALDTAGTIILTQTVEIPDTVTGPTRYLYIETDSPSGIAETNENNNRIRSGAIRITPVIYPDLEASNVQVSSASLLTDRNYAVSYTVTNNGPADIIGRSFEDRIYISASPVWNESNARQIKSLPQNMTLLQGTSYSVTDSIHIDLPVLGNLDSGHYYIYVFSDAGRTIKEQGGETNNYARSSQVTLSHLPFPDLTVMAASSADSAKSGSRILVTYRVKNGGGTYGLNGFWFDGVYFSQDSILSDNDPLAGSRLISMQLLPDSSYQISLYATVPNGYSGNYYMLVATDYQKMNRDRNRDNNYRKVAVMVNGQPVEGPVYVSLTPPSDLVAVSFQAQSTGMAGQPVTVKLTVQNQRRLTNKAAWTDKFYLSTDQQVGNGDQLLLAHPHTGSLDSSLSYIESVQLFLPVTAAGNYYLLATTDANDVVYESNELNNSRPSFIFVIRPQPSDLIVQSVLAPASGILGDSATITWIIKNIDSNAATGTIRQGIYFDNNPIWNDSSSLLYSQYYQVNIPGSGTDTFTQKIKLRSIDPGLQYVSVRTDMLNNIPERNEQNNTTTSPQSTAVTVRQLPLNDTIPALLTNNNEIYYRIEVPAGLSGGAILLSLFGDSANATNELYVRYDNVPTRITYDLTYDRSASGSQQIVIPDLKEGTYYILAYGQSSLHNQQNIRLLAESIDFKMRSIVTNRGGNTGYVTVKISGARFESGMQAILNNDSLGRIVASRVLFVNSTAIYATFNLANARIGEYTAGLIKINSDSTLLPNSFTVKKGSAGQVADNGGPAGFYCHIENIDAEEFLDLRENVPPAVLPRFAFPMRIVYGNSGDIDIAIQHYILTCLTQVPVSADPSEMLRALAQLLGGNLPSTLASIFLTLDEPGGAAVLRPGFQYTKTVYSILPFAGEYKYRLMAK